MRGDFSQRLRAIPIYILFVTHDEQEASATYEG